MNTSTQHSTVAAALDAAIASKRVDASARALLSETYSVRSDQLDKLSSASARRAVEKSLSTEFKCALACEQISSWVAYKLASCDAAQQSTLLALYVAQNARIVTADIDAVKRNAFSRNTERVESFDAAATVANVKLLRNNAARIVERTRRTTETTRDALSASQNASAFDSVASVALSLTAERDALTRALNAAAARVSALSSALAAHAENVDSAERQIAALDLRDALSAHDALKRLAAERSTSKR